MAKATFVQKMDTMTADQVVKLGLSTATDFLRSSIQHHQVWVTLISKTFMSKDKNGEHTRNTQHMTVLLQGLWEKFPEALLPVSVERWLVNTCKFRVNKQHIISLDKTVQYNTEWFNGVKASPRFDQKAATDLWKPLPNEAPVSSLATFFAKDMLAGGVMPNAEEIGKKIVDEAIKAMSSKKNQEWLAIYLEQVAKGQIQPLHPEVEGEKAAAPMQH